MMSAVPCSNKCKKNKHHTFITLYKPCFMLTQFKLLIMKLVMNKIWLWLKKNGCDKKKMVIMENWLWWKIVYIKQIIVLLNHSDRYVLIHFIYNEISCTEIMVVLK